MSVKNFRRVLAVAVFGVLGLVTPASAADLAVSLDAGYRDLTNAPESADALFGSRGGPTFGAGVRTVLGSGFFLSASGRFLQLDGERVAVGPNGEVFPLGHELTFRMIPLYGTLGYRFNSDGRLVPYVGAGAGVTLVREESEIAGETESASSTKFSGQAIAGVEFGQGRFRVAGEVGYELVPDALGDGGVSEQFDESDLGGFSAVVKFVIVP